MEGGRREADSGGSERSGERDDASSAALSAHLGVCSRSSLRLRTAMS
jgi:hypothetical protein